MFPTIALCTISCFHLHHFLLTSLRSRVFPVHQYEGHVAVINRDSGTLSIISPDNLAISATVTLPDQAEPIYFGLSYAKFEIWDGDRASIRLVILKIFGDMIKFDSSDGCTVPESDRIVRTGPNPFGLIVLPPVEKKKVKLVHSQYGRPRFVAWT